MLINPVLLNRMQKKAIHVYGFLYNYYALSDSRDIAAAGWRVPSTEDYTTMIEYLGGESVAGGKMKETGTIRWNAPNSGATNESGFTAVGAGYRGIDGEFSSLKVDGILLSKNTLFSSGTGFNSGVR